MIGVYGSRLATFGSLSLVVLSFIDGHLTGDDIVKSTVIFFLGCVWFLLSSWWFLRFSLINWQVRL
jgi:hypothetical protein